MIVYFAIFGSGHCKKYQQSMKKILKEKSGNCWPDAQAQIQ